ncbi:hypothetical protein [Micromonospora sp. NPDC005652]|uniref:hypothetical protein n=1 Tax=Micromonospora sp. NPDC005652 TaxID=3157046 RepID=UPI00340C73DD
MTKFLALVARESLAEVYPLDGDWQGDACHVVRISQRGTQVHIGIERGADRRMVPLDAVEPSRALVALVESGTYDEATMTWTSRTAEGLVLLPLSY